MIACNKLLQEIILKYFFNSFNIPTQLFLCLYIYIYIYIVLKIRYFILAFLKNMHEYKNMYLLLYKSINYYISFSSDIFRKIYFILHFLLFTSIS